MDYLNDRFAVVLVPSSSVDSDFTLRSVTTSSTVANEASIWIVDRLLTAPVQAKTW